jgi:hypothetical protein
MRLWRRSKCERASACSKADNGGSKESGASNQSRKLAEGKPTNARQGCNPKKITEIQERRLGAARRAVCGCEGETEESTSPKATTAREAEAAIGVMHVQVL